MSTLNINLSKFDMKSMPDDAVVVFIGRRRVGKSWLVKNLLYHHRDIPIATIISGTEGANGFYSQFNPSLFIHHEFSSALVANVLKRQRIVQKEKKREIEEKGSSKIDTRGILLLDDCLYDNTWVKDVSIKNLFMNGRHFNMMFIITMQYVLGIPPNLRTNVDYVFICREPYTSNRKRIYEAFAGVFETFDVFCQVMDQCTENYECLVINTASRSNKIEDQVFWYKAETHDDFKMGAEEYWKYHNENFEDDSLNDEKDDNNNPNKKTKTKVLVKKAS